MFIAVWLLLTASSMQAQKFEDYFMDRKILDEPLGV